MNIMDYQKEVRKMDKDEDINQLTDLLIDNEIDERTIEIALSIICHRFSFTSGAVYETDDIRFFIKKKHIVMDLIYLIEFRTLFLKYLGK